MSSRTLWIYLLCCWAPSWVWAKPILVDRLEASVNAGIILNSDVTQFKRTMTLRTQLDPLFTKTAIAEKGTSASSAEIVDYLVNEKVITNAFPAADPEVDQAVSEVLATNQITKDALKKIILEQGYGFNEYYEIIRMSTSKRKLVDNDIRSKVVISDDDVKNYFYNQLSKNSRSNFSYRVKIITIRPKGSRSETIERAQKAMQAVKAGQPFEEVAKKYSDDPTAENGGDLGLLPEEDITPEIRNEIKNLQVGSVSDLLGSADTAYFILKLADLHSGEEQKLEQKKEDIRGQLAAKEYQHQIALWIERNKQQAFIRKAGEPTLFTSHGN